MSSPIRIESAAANANGGENAVEMSPPLVLPDGFRRLGDLLLCGAAALGHLHHFDWLIDGVLPRQCVAFVYGASGSGKSFITLDIAMHVALGMRWFDRPIQQGPVLVVLAEGECGTAPRVKAWLEHRGLGAMPANVGFLTGRLQIDDPDGFEAVRAAVATFAEACGTPALIVIDTFSASVGALDENLAADARRVMGHLQRLAEQFRACVCVVHHTGKDSSRGMRGSSLLLADADVAIEVAKDPKEGKVGVKVRKQKDGPCLRFSAGLLPVEFGTNARGESLTTLVVIPDKRTHGHTDAVVDSARSPYDRAIITTLLAAGPNGCAWSEVVDRARSVNPALTRAKSFAERRQHLVTARVLEERAGRVRLSPESATRYGGFVAS
ncbi:MAG: AAA family ATPase [Pseudomonadota bacterium]